MLWKHNYHLSILTKCMNRHKVAHRTRNIKPKAGGDAKEVISSSIKSDRQVN